MGRGGFRQLRLKLIAGHRAPAPEPSGFGDTAAGVGSADPQSLGQDCPPRLGAHFLGGGLGLQLDQQRMFGGGLAASMDFQPLQNLQDLGSAEGLNRQRRQLVPRHLEVVQRGHHRLGVGGVHIHESNTSSKL